MKKKTENKNNVKKRTGRKQGINSTGKKGRKSTEKKVRGGGEREKYGGNCTGKMYRQKVWEKKYGEKKETEGKHKTNGEINEKTNKKRQRESNRPCIMSLHFGDSSIYLQ